MLQGKNRDEALEGSGEGRRAEDEEKSLSLQINQARSAQRVAEQALYDHIADHGCLEKS